MKDIKIAIIGGGPAGIAAAIQLKRYMLNPILFESKQLGGLLKNAWKIDNYPGFPGGITGLKLMELFQYQLERFNIDVKYEKVGSLDFNETTALFEVQTNTDTYQFDVVIVASGTQSKKLDLVESLPEEIKKKSFYEVYPLFSEEDKRIAIIGAGDAAFDYAVNLSRRNTIIILNRAKSISALPLLQEFAGKSDKIDYRENSQVNKIELSSNNQLSLTITQNGNNEVIEADYLLVAIGRLENKYFYSDYIRNNEKKLQEKGLLPLAGDVKNGLFRQTSISVGDGVKCAMKIYQNLKMGKYENIG